MQYIYIFCITGWRDYKEKQRNEGDDDELHVCDMELEWHELKCMCECVFKQEGKAYSDKCIQL